VSSVFVVVVVVVVDVLAGTGHIVKFCFAINVSKIMMNTKGFFKLRIKKNKKMCFFNRQQESTEKAAKHRF
jgi:hypothetical protein